MADYDSLETFARSGTSQYIKFDEMNPVEGIYTGFSLEPDVFNPGEQRVIYDLEINNERKTIASSSKRLARAVLAAKPEAGNFIRITRTGEGFDTNYTVETSDLPF